MDFQELQQIALQELRGKIPRSQLEEFEYTVNAYSRGKIAKESFVAVVQDVIRELGEIRPPAITRQKTKRGSAFYINTDTDGPSFTLLSEPTENGFLPTYHDIEEREDLFRADDPLEQKGRIVKPLLLDNYLDFLLYDRKKTMGVDIARFGDDKTVLLVLYGGHVIDIQAYYKQDGAETTGRIIEAINEHHPDEVIIDVTGGFGVVLDNLYSLEMDALTIITGVTFNALPRDPDKYKVADARTEMYVILQEKLRRGEITLPFHEPLIQELMWIKYKPRLDGKFMLESKDKFKSTNKRSPDHADALALSVYGLGRAEIYT